VPAAHFCARGFASLLHRLRIEGWAERRETFGCCAKHPLGVHITRHARRLARRLAARNAGRSPLGAPPWRFWAPGARFSHLHPPLREASARSRSVTASSSHPGHSAWRAGSLPSETSGYKPSPQNATPRSVFRSLPEDALNERGCILSSIGTIRSQ